MKNLKRWAILSSFSVLVLGGFVLLYAQEGAEGPFRGGSYLTIIRDAGGNLSSRSVITLNSDQTMAAIDSAQQGPINYFGDQMGMWKPLRHNLIAGRTINFRYLPNAPGIARSDYVISLGPGGKITGTVTLRTFPPEGNPLKDEGTLIGTYTLEGEPVER